MGHGGFPNLLRTLPGDRSARGREHGNFARVKVVTEPLYHGACEYVYYKHPEDIPEEFYTRIGKEKPLPGNG